VGASAAVYRRGYHPRARNGAAPISAADGVAVCTRSLLSQRSPADGFRQTCRSIWTARMSRTFAFVHRRSPALESAEETAAFAGWQSSSDVVEFGTHRHLTDPGPTTSSGRLLPRRRAFPSGTSLGTRVGVTLAGRLCGVPHRSSLGIFAAVSLSQDGRGSVATDPLSVALLHRSETSAKQLRRVHEIYEHEDLKFRKRYSQQELIAPMKCDQPQSRHHEQCLTRQADRGRQL
jgi:hypothetical protein